VSIRVWLVRHGETEWNAQLRLAGLTDLELTARGREQARRLRPLVEQRVFDGVWSSDLIRASETARLAYGDADLDERLRELDFGELEGATWIDIPPDLQSSLQSFDGFEAPGGESTDSMKVRVRQFLDGLASGDHLVFTHGGVVRMVLRDCGEDRFPQNSEIVVVDWTSRRVLDRHHPQS